VIGCLGVVLFALILQGLLGEKKKVVEAAEPLV
jgi:hypothetical protein